MIARHYDFPLWALLAAAFIGGLIGLVVSR